MVEYLSKIRKPHIVLGIKKHIYPLAIFILGIMFGILSKSLDETATNLLPAFIQSFDLRNFFSRMGIWIFIAICISVYSKNPIRAGTNVLFFFIGVVGSYYLYTTIIAGFYPKSYMMIWIVITLFTPFLGVICWYAKGVHIISVGISSFIFAIMALTAFNLGGDFSYFDVSHFLELIVFFTTVLVLYNNPKQILKVITGGSVLFILLSLTSLRHYIF